MTSMHFLISILVVLRVQYSTYITLLPSVLIHLTHSVDIHLPYSAVIFSLATHRFDYLFFVKLLFHAAASIHHSFRKLPLQQIFRRFSLITYYLHFHLAAHLTQNPISNHFFVTTRFYILCFHLTFYPEPGIFKIIASLWRCRV